MESRRAKRLFASILALSIIILLCGTLVHSHNAFISRSSRSMHSISDLEEEPLGLGGTNHLIKLNQLRKKRRTTTSGDVTNTESESSGKCDKQKEHFADLRQKLKDGERLEKTHVFTDVNKYNLAFVWTGDNDEGKLLVLATEAKFLGQASSTLLRSVDYGRTWDNWNSHVDGNVFRKDDGIQRNPHCPKKVYLISYEHFMYITEDGGDSWNKVELVKDEEEKTKLAIDEQLNFHPEPEFEDYVLLVTNDRQMLVTYNNFRSDLGAPIKANVHSFKWGTKETGSQKKIYVTTGESKDPLLTRVPALLDLERYESQEKGWTTLLKRVIKFDVEGKFIYASIYKSEKPKSEEDEKLMMISSDGGDTWNAAQLPTLTGNRFFSVLDMSEGLIFMHVDNPGDTGHGILYTSASDGVVYSESLRNHLFPNYNTVHDFYKVESIRGVYLASQMGHDDSIHTVITYTRGAEWMNVTRPIGAGCENAEKEGCFLQIHNAYSIHRGIKASRPKSQKLAYGVFLVHAHVASNLQTTTPDVFLSTDGGYNFRKVLKGPHVYEIADSGGLLVAVSLESPYPDTVKFSVDEGHCWHTYKYTNETIRFTGLLTEPGGKSMTIMLWGYTKDDKKWTVNIIDFNRVVTKECKDDDYVDWTPHTSLSPDPKRSGCLLGQKETFKKIKQDSWCRNGYNKHMATLSEKCACVKEDYECDYGFYRKVNSDICIRQPEIRAEEIQLCKEGHEEVVSAGYRKIPQDVCDDTRGFKPSSQYIDLQVLCAEKTQETIVEDTKPPPKNTGSGKLVIWAVVIIVVLLLAVVGAFFAYKAVLLRRHKVVYRYSMLNQTDTRDDDFENALTSHDTLYKDSSDDEVEQENRSPQNLANGGRHTASRERPPVKSYHDDSDDDLLN